MDYKASAFIGAALAAAIALPAQADPLTGEYWIQLRYRFEHVDQAGFAEDAKASTLRARIGGRTREVNGFSLLLEADSIIEVGDADYNDGVTQNPDRLRYPVVADPKGTDLNQGYVQYRNEWVTARAGRQRINYDNQRFVGAVGWRQHEQTFDSIGAEFGAGQPWRVNYAYVTRVKRIFGERNDAGRHDHDTHLLNAGYGLDEWGTIGGYWYQIDNEDAPAQSTQTFGLRWQGDRPLADWRFSWLAEAARQSDHSNNPVDYDANYLRLDGAITFELAKLGIGFERLAGDAARPGAAFRTPLATLHKFNGWADAFLATPQQGLDDVFISVSGNASGFNWAAIYHDFSAESGSGDFGDEIDLSLSRKFGSHYSGLLKYARYDGGSLGVADRDKFWLMVTASW